MAMTFHFSVILVCKSSIITIKGEVLKGYKDKVVIAFKFGLLKWKL